MRHLIPAVGLAAAICLITGCGSGQTKLENQYDFKERSFEAVQTAQLPELADPFASGLCVVLDENQNQDAGINADDVYKRQALPCGGPDSGS